jgi:5'-methylthioadenosine phosphorylase
VTDYDCWRPHRGQVDQLRLLEEIIANVRAATQAALALIRSALPAAHAMRESACSCRSALALAIWSDKSLISAAERERLAPLIGRYL